MSNLIRFETGSVILDAGEGTLSQLSRQYGDSLPNLLGDIHCVFISHLHADHHLGFISLASEIMRQSNEPLYVLAPWRFLLFIQEMADMESIDIERIIFISNEDPKSANLDSLYSKLGLSSIATVRVQHCPWAYGIVLTTKSNSKIVFSGDTRPCSALVEAGMNATLLIHEATLDDNYQEEAKIKRHCTTSEALDIARRMQAKNVLLTHFSQRYPKLPTFLFDSSRDSSHQQLGIGFDLLQCKLKDFWKLAHYNAAIKELFKDEEEIMKRRADGDLRLTHKAQRV